MKRKKGIAKLLEEHFGADPHQDLVVLQRVFPLRMRADVQRALQADMASHEGVLHFGGVLQRYDHTGLDVSGLLAPNPHDPAMAVPPQYEEIDVGEEDTVQALENGLWLLEEGGERYAVLLARDCRFGQCTGLKVQVAGPQGEVGATTVRRLFERLEQAVRASPCYRGKVLSLELPEHFMGHASGLKVHVLRPVRRDEVVLPQRTLDLVDRNVIGFCRQRARLRKLGLPTRKGLLFYGPPGTGKTHTIQYLASALAGHTTLLVTAEQVVMIGEYLAIARLLQPSIVVIEDVDLIARDRKAMRHPGEELLLNKLLNEMDGLRPDADILFLLTTNRPESLEAALASRPGRVDQAIEFPLPDAEGRRRLIQLYACGLELPDDVIDDAVRRTEGVSASFVKELMRRVAQFLLQRDAEASAPTKGDLDEAMDELLFAGGSLNLHLLGATQARAVAADDDAGRTQGGEQAS